MIVPVLALPEASRTDDPELSLKLNAATRPPSVGPWLIGVEVGEGEGVGVPIGVAAGVGVAEAGGVVAGMGGDVDAPGGLVPLT